MDLKVTRFSQSRTFKGPFTEELFRGVRSTVDVIRVEVCVKVSFRPQLNSLALVSLSIPDTHKTSFARHESKISLQYKIA